MIGPGFDGVLTAAQCDAPWAFQRLFEDLSPVVNGYLRARGCREPDDVASEAFLSIFRAIKQFEGTESDFRSWVFTIVHRRLIDERRKSGRRAAQTPIDALHRDIQGGDAEREAVEGMASAWVHDVLSVLNDDQRDVILLRVIADLSVNEVAEIMERRPGAVRTLQHRAITHLRDRLADRPEVLEALSRRVDPDDTVVHHRANTATVEIPAGATGTQREQELVAVPIAGRSRSHDAPARNPARGGPR